MKLLKFARFPTRYVCATPLASSVLRSSLKNRLGFLKSSIRHISGACSNIIKSSNDKEREYLSFSLPNGLKTLLVSDPSTTEAAASMDILTGYFDDPQDIPGLAHFCEHMLFLGTKNYPDESSFKQFLSKNGGFSNASTAGEHTNYFFSVRTEKLDEALDRFLSFFSCPLFTEDATLREINAVHAEFMRNLQDDGRRLLQLLKSSCNPDHQFSKFSTGNLDTLTKYDVHHLRERLLDFHRTNYVPSKMKLVCYGRESIEELMEMVRNKFDALSMQSMSPGSGSSLAASKSCSTYNLINEESAKLLQYAVPIRDSRKIMIFWELPSQYEYYETKPSYFIGHLLEQQSKNSLFSHLKSLGWINNISAHLYTSSTFFSLFTVNVDLTENGLDNIFSVIQKIFECIKMIEETVKNDSANYIFEECSRVLDNRFHWLEKSSPSNYASSLSKRLQYLPEEDLLYGPYKMKNYDKNMILETLQKLNPQNMKLQVISKSFESLSERVEPIYKTRFYEAPIPSTTMHTLNHIKQNENIQPPPKNSFIAQNFNLRQIQDKKIYPEIAFHDPVSKSKIWHKEHTNFLTPIVHINSVIKISEDYVHHVKGELMIQFFIHFVNETLENIDYQAQQANLGYDIGMDLYMELCLGGFHDKMPQFSKEVFNALKNPLIKRESFERIRNNLLRFYQNQYKLQASTQATHKIRYVTQQDFKHFSRYITILHEITFDEVTNFSQHLLNRIRIESFANGNFTKDEAGEFINTINSSLSHTSLNEEEIPTLKILQLHSGRDHIVEFESTNPLDENSSVVIHFQIGNRDLKKKCMIELLQQMIKAPFFHQLRTEQQLGYIIHSYPIIYTHTLAFELLIQSPTHSPPDIYHRMNQFLIQFGDTLDKTTQEEFEHYKETLIQLKNRPHQKLAQETNYYWNEIYTERLAFDRVDREILALREIQKDHMNDFFHTYFLHASPSHTNSSPLGKISSLCFGKKFNIGEHSISRKPEMQNPNIEIIDNVVQFRKKLGVFPKI